jgi:hypothetical protein
LDVFCNLSIVAIPESTKRLTDFSPIESSWRNTHGESSQALAVTDRKLDGKKQLC